MTRPDARFRPLPCIPERPPLTRLAQTARHVTSPRYRLPIAPLVWAALMLAVGAALGNAILQALNL